MTYHAYYIECHSNLHVGSGDNDFGIIDKQVQKDTVTKRPMIHASSLKGALREFFKENHPNFNLEKYFGTDKNSSNPKQGCLRFFQADLLAIPVPQGTATSTYSLATSDEIVNNEFPARSKVFGIPASDPVKKWGLNAIPNNAPELTQLPIVARNSLDNGQSENLWYEEFVPRKSIFYFFIGVEEHHSGIVNYAADFESQILSDSKNQILVQIGANATVGQGYCTITKIQ